MQVAPRSPNEEERLEALRQTGVLDTEREESFDRLTDLAAKLCGAPIALITLVEVDRQWFKSKVGLEVSETPRDVAFCAHAILHPGTLIVSDALEDERFADNPLVTSDPKIRFYAGSPLVTHDGVSLGTLCVIDTVPRELDARQIEALGTLSRHAAILLDLRRTKELLRRAAADWESADTAGDAANCTAALDTLGDNLRHMIAAREEAEQFFRELERQLSEIAPAADSPGPGIGELLGEIGESCDRLLDRLGSDHPLRREAVRIRDCARRVRKMLE